MSDMPPVTEKTNAQFAHWLNESIEDIRGKLDEKCVEYEELELMLEILRFAKIGRIDADLVNKRNRIVAQHGVK